MLNYRCLVLDHDDTVVRSEETVNYPSFLEALKVLRPGRTITREEFTRWCFSPGFSALCSDYIGLTPEEIDVQYDMWRSYVATRIPPPYDGLRPILTRWKQEGGLLCASRRTPRVKTSCAITGCTSIWSRIRFSTGTSARTAASHRPTPCRRSCGCMTCVRMSY